MLTTKRLEKFVRIRNNSGYHSNMAFQSDLMQVNAKLSDLGPVLKFKMDNFIGYQWDVPVKDRKEPIRMIEFGCRLGLDIRAEDVQLFELVKRKAVEVPIKDEATQ